MDESKFTVTDFGGTAQVLGYTRRFAYRATDGRLSIFGLDESETKMVLGALYLRGAVSPAVQEAAPQNAHPGEAPDGHDAAAFAVQPAPVVNVHVTTPAAAAPVPPPAPEPAKPPRSRKAAAAPQASPPPTPTPVADQAPPASPAPEPVAAATEPADLGCRECKMGLTTLPDGRVHCPNGHYWRSAEAMRAGKVVQRADECVPFADPPQPEQQALPIEPTPAPAGGNGKGYDVEILRKAQTLRAVLEHLFDRGYTQEEELVSTCVALKAQVPVLGRVSAMPERIKRALAVMGRDDG